jgi:hypothetical protein
MRMRVRADYGFMALCLTWPMWTCLDVSMTDARQELQAIIDSVKADARPTDNPATLEARVIGEFIHCPSFDSLSSTETDSMLTAAFYQEA